LFTPDLLKYVMAPIAAKEDTKEVSWKAKQEGFVYITGKICLHLIIYFFTGKDLFTLNGKDLFTPDYLFLYGEGFVYTKREGFVYT